MPDPDRDEERSLPRKVRARRLARSLGYMVALAFRADPVRATAALVLSAVAAGGQAGIAFMSSRVIGAAIEGDVDRAVQLGIALAILAAVLFGAAMGRLDLRFRMEESTSLLVDRELIELTAGIPGLEHHERPEHLDRLELLRQQRAMLAGSVGALIENVGTFASIATTVTLLVSVHPALIALPLFGVPSVVTSARIRAAWRRVEEETAERGRLAEHLFELGTTGPPAKELRVFGLQDELRSRHEALRGSVDAEVDAMVRSTTIKSTAAWAFFAVGYVGAVTFVLLQALDGAVPPADVILVLTLAGQVDGQVQAVYWMVGWLVDTLRTVGRYLRLVDDAAEARPPIVGELPVPERLTRGIELDGVTFRYPGTEIDVLREVRLLLPAGRTIAVVGDNGAGKSSLMKLLSRFYEPTEGRILVDGVDIRRFDVESWRERMAAGFQDFAKLELLARETVGVGSLPDIDDDTFVRGALDRAAASDLEGHLRDGLETPVGKSFEGGIDLSGGQWQKLALGRAMMRDRPLLLVLDEPTAALDADTEHALFERYAVAAREAAAVTGGITVLVSHRFSTVRMADLIVVIRDGTVAECGTHAELMALAGAYAELYELQARAYR